MKKTFLILVFSFVFCLSAYADNKYVVFNEEGKFGLKVNNEVVVKPIYKKFIKLGENSYIALKRNRYGIVDIKGDVILPFKYSHASRFMGRFAKLKSSKGYGLYDEYANIIVPQNSEDIQMFSHNYFLVRQNYKYGIYDKEGNVVLKCVCDDIDYVDFVKSNVIRLKYQGEWYQIEQVGVKELTLPAHMQDIEKSSEFKITKLITDPISASKYSAISTADYSLKIFSSISPAYEATIDDLILSQGADGISIFMKIGWLPKFPFVFAKNYWRHFKNPYSGPLSDVKNNVKKEF